MSTAPKTLRFRSRQAGFTIVELMIATVVFSVILLVVTAGVLHFSSSYYKGINSSTTQNAARSITDTVSQAIQFGAGTPASGTTTGGQPYSCFGTVEFVSFLGKQVTASQHGLVEVPVSSCTNNPNLATGRELLQTHMHLADFTVSAVGVTGTLYSVSIKVVYADNNSSGTNDLLCAPTAKVGSCGPSGSLSAADMANAAVLKDARCKSQIGSQFCATANLMTTVNRRLNT